MRLASLVVVVAHRFTKADRVCSGVFFLQRNARRSRSGYAKNTLSEFRCVCAFHGLPCDQLFTSSSLATVHCGGSVSQVICERAENSDIDDIGKSSFPP